jgi:hypothetical protein
MILHILDKVLYAWCNYLKQKRASVAVGAGADPQCAKRKFLVVLVLNVEVKQATLRLTFHCMQVHIVLIGLLCCVSLLLGLCSSLQGQKMVAKQQMMVYFMQLLEPLL